MKNQAKLMLDMNCSSANHESPEQSNIIDDYQSEHINSNSNGRLNEMARNEASPFLLNGNTNQRSTPNTSKKLRKRAAYVFDTSSDSSEEDEVPLSRLARQMSTASSNNTDQHNQSFDCTECGEEFTKIYLYETHKETVHSSYPIDASPNVDTRKIFVQTGGETILRFKCKYCSYQSGSMWDTRRHQISNHSGEETPRRLSTNSSSARSPIPQSPPKSQITGGKLVKVLSPNAIEERVPLIKAAKNLTNDQMLKMFYGLTCNRCKPHFELSNLDAFEEHCRDAHKLTDIAFLCCKVKWRKDMLLIHMKYHLDLPAVYLGNKNLEMNIKKRHVVPAAAIHQRRNSIVKQMPKKKGGWPKGKPRGLRSSK